MIRESVLKICLILLFGFFSIELIGQEVSASLGFESDSMLVGSTVELRLEISHPQNIPIFLPGENSSFGVFEWVSTKASPTLTQEGISYDEAVYTLRSFELKKWQYLDLRYGYLSGKDTVFNTIRSDSVRLKERIPFITQFLTYKRDKQILSLNPPPNYFLLGFLICIALGGLIGLGALIRKPLKRYWESRLIRGEWQAVRRNLAKLRQKITNQALFIDELNHLWKDYLSEEWEIPLRSLTTTELIPVITKQTKLATSHRDVLIESAKMSDQIIYADAKLPEDDLILLLKKIQPIMEAAYKRKRDQKLEEE